MTGPLPAFSPFDAEVVDDHDDRAPARRRVSTLAEHLLTLGQLAQRPPATPLVDCLLYRGTLAQLAAAAGSYKTFLAIALICAVATGRNFDSYRVPTAETVLLIAAEGAQGIAARIYAWCEVNNVDPAEVTKRLHILASPIQLGQGSSVAEAADLVERLQPGLIVLDTRARCTVGLEENSATEQGRAVQALEQIMACSPESTALVIHHAGRSGSTPRGSSAWDGAVWSDLRMEGADLLAKVHCEKHKDAPAGCDHHFRLVPHTVSENLLPGHPEESRKSLVIVQNDAWTPRLTAGKSESTVLDIVWTCAMSDGMSKAEVRDAAVEQNVKRSTVYAAMNSLVDKGFLQNIGTDTRPRFTVTATGKAHLSEAS